MGTYDKHFVRLAYAAILFLVLLPESPAQEHEKIRIKSEPDYPPFCMVDEQGNAAGFSVDLFTEAAKIMNIDVSVEVGFWNDIKEELKDGKIDALPLVGRSAEREAYFDFTIPYHSMHGAIFVKKRNKSIHAVQDLRQKCVAVMAGDNAEEYVRRAEISEKIITTPTFEDAFELLSEGTCDAVIAQQLMGVMLIKKNDIRGVHPLNIPLTGFSQDFSFAVEEGNKQLLAALNEGLSLVLANGTYETLHNKWFSNLPGYKPGFKDIVKAMLPMLLITVILLAAVSIVFLKYEVSRQTVELNRTRLKYKRLAESINAVVYEISENGEFWSYVSPNSQTILGYGSSEWNGIDFWSERIDETQREETVQNLLNAIQYPGHRSFEFRFKIADGSFIWLKNQITVEKINNSKTIIGFMTDITHEKDLQRNLEDQLSEKETILRESHHRMKNNFINIENIINLQLMELSGTEARNALRETVGRVKSIRVLYERLLIEGGSKELPVREYINNLVAEIFLTFSESEQINYDTDIIDAVFSQKTLFPIGLIINEAITNTIKYAENKQDGLRMDITLKKIDDSYFLCIRDNGRSVPEIPAADDKHHMGLNLITILTTQLNGTLSLSTANGMSIEIKFPS